MHREIYLRKGTKINLSLSALGNVIHALTSNSEHIPYRDSKLTRLLQESLGGNYKTSLIVACSPHSSQMKETISSLQFAQRAKKLKNNVQINFKRAPEDLLKIIDQLQRELKLKNIEIQRMRNSTYYEKKDSTQIKAGIEEENIISEYNNVTEQPRPSHSQKICRANMKIPHWKSYHKLNIQAEVTEEYEQSKRKNTSTDRDQD